MWAQPHKEKTGDREETVIVRMHCYCSAYYFYNHLRVILSCIVCVHITGLVPEVCIILCRTCAPWKL